MAIAVEGRRDIGVAHVGREGLCIDAGGDEVARARMAALVEADRLKPGLPPGPLCSLIDCARREGSFAGPAEHQPGLTPRAKSMLDQELAEHGGDRNAPAAGATLRLHGAR